MMTEQILGYGSDIHTMLETGELHEVLVESGFDAEGAPLYEPIRVSPKAPYHDAEYGHTLFEWEDTNGLVRASLLLVPAGKSSPKWHIKPEAGKSNYIEYEALLRGSGKFTCMDDDGVSITEPLPSDQERLQGVIPMPLIVEPGDTFQVHADAAPKGGQFSFAGYTGGLLLGSFFRRGHFELEHEERVS